MVGVEPPVSVDANPTTSRPLHLATVVSEDGIGVHPIGDHYALIGVGLGKGGEKYKKGF